MTAAALSPLDIFQATAMLLSDQLEHTPSVAFFHARPRDDDDELFTLLDRLIWKTNVRVVVINGSNGAAFDKTMPGEAWLGADAYEERLRTVLRRRPDNIVRSRPAFHTREEADAFLEVARERKWEYAYILTLPHHMPRAFLSMIQAMCANDYRMRVYAAAPSSVDWRKGVPGSQGAGMARRRDHIAGELERIARYQASGQLASFADLHAYLQWRDD